MATDEIKIVTAVGGVPGDRYCKCPHCGEQVNLPRGSIRGEQFQHRILRLSAPHAGCGGWFEVSCDARLARAE